MTNETRSLEEALADLGRSEVRASLETYVPVSYELFHDHPEAYERGILDVAHVLVDIRAKEIQAYRPHEVEFLHGLVDMISKTPSDREPDKRKEHEEQIYQFAKKYIHENYDVAKVVEARIEAFYEMAREISQEGGVPITNYLDPSRLESILSCRSKSVAEKMKSKLGTLPWIPCMNLEIGEYLNTLRRYITEETGQALRWSNPDIALMANHLLPYRVLQIGTFDCSPLVRIYQEAVVEIPGLKDKIVDIGRKYGVEIWS